GGIKSRVVVALQAPESAQSDKTHRLNAQEVINSFAKKRIVCSVIKPNEHPNMQETMTNLAASADIVVIDWDLNEKKDKGKKALNILKHISDVAADTPSQLRLFAIYTGEPDLVNIVKKIKETLGNEATVDKAGFTVNYQCVRIAVFAKPYTSLPEQYQDRKVG